MYKTKEFTDVCAKVSEQTDCNDHTGAKITISRYFRLPHYVKVFQGIEKENFSGNYL